MNRLLIQSRAQKLMKPVPRGGSQKYLPFSAQNKLVKAAIKDVNASRNKMATYERWANAFTDIENKGGWGLPGYRQEPFGSAKLRWRSALNDGTIHAGTDWKF